MVIGRLESEGGKGRNGFARRVHVALALNGKRNSTADPANSGVKSALMAP